MQSEQQVTKLKNKPKRHIPSGASPLSKYSRNRANLAIRRANYQDMPTIAGFISSSADWYRKFVDPKDMDQHEVDQEWIDDNFFRREFFLGVDGDTPVGTVTLQTLGEDAYLGYVYLDAKHVGKGFGHQLMDHAKKISKERGLEGMVLIAHPQAKWATKAYEKYGFECIARKKEDVLSWNDGALKPYYEEGFHLYRYPIHP